TATLQSSSDARYARSVDITYTVVPPPSGEQALSVDPPYLNLTLQQGSRSLQHLTVTRPTWTSVWDTPQLVGDTVHAFTLIDQGGGLYDLAIDTAGLGLGSYSVSVVFSAGASGGSTSVRATVSVSSAF